MAENFRMDGKTAIVTGAGSGIGKAIARRFAAAGASVCLLDMQGKRAQETAEQIAADGSQKAITVACDVTDSGAVSQRLRRHSSHSPVKVGGPPQAHLRCTSPARAGVRESAGPVLARAGTRSLIGLALGGVCPTR